MTARATYARARRLSDAAHALGPPARAQRTAERSWQSVALDGACAAVEMLLSSGAACLVCRRPWRAAPRWRDMCIRSYAEGGWGGRGAERARGLWGADRRRWGTHGVRTRAAARGVGAGRSMVRCARWPRGSLEPPRRGCVRTPWGGTRDGGRSALVLALPGVRRALSKDGEESLEHLSHSCIVKGKSKRRTVSRARGDVRLCESGCARARDPPPGERGPGKRGRSGTGVARGRPERAEADGPVAPDVRR